MRSQIRDFSPGGRRLNDMPDRLRCDIGPSLMSVALTHSSTARFAHTGTGTVRMRFPFPIRSASTQCSSRIWKACLWSPTSSARRSPQPINKAKMARSRLPESCLLRGFGALFNRQPVADPHPKALSTLHAANARSQFRAQQSRVGSLVRKSADGGQAHIDSGWSEVVLLQEESIPEHNGPAEGQSWFRAVPADEFVDRMAIRFLRTRSRQGTAVLDCSKSGSRSTVFGFDRLPDFWRRTILAAS